MVLKEKLEKHKENQSPSSPERSGAGLGRFQDPFIFNFHWKQYVFKFFLFFKYSLDFSSFQFKTIGFP